MTQTRLAVAFTAAAALTVNSFWALGVTDDGLFLAQIFIAIPAMALTSWLFLRETAREPTPAWRVPRRPGEIGDGASMRFLAWTVLLGSGIALVPLVLSLAHAVLRSY